MEVFTRSLPMPQDNGQIDEQEVKPFRLLDLPPELWTKIGKLIVDAHPTVRTWREKKELLEQPSITRASVVLRSELLPYYYKTRICLRLWRYSLLAKKVAWLEKIGPANRRHLGDVHLISEAGKVDQAVEHLKREGLTGLWELGPGTKPGALDIGWICYGKKELLHRITFK